MSEAWAVGVDTASARVQMVGSSGWEFGFDCAKVKDNDERRLTMFRAASSAFAQVPDGSLVLIEEPISLLNGRTNRVLAMAAGVIWLAATIDWRTAVDAEFCPRNIFTGWVDISQWKLQIVGKGNASKEEIRTHVLQDGGPDYDVADFFDAHCIMRYAEQVMRAIEYAT